MLCASGKTLIDKDNDGCTSSRWRHLKKWHPIEHRKILPPLAKQRTIDGMLGKEGKKKSKYVGLTEEVIRDECALLVMDTNSPISIVDGYRLTRFASVFAQEDVKLPSSRTVKELSFKIFDEWKEKLRMLLRPFRRVALTVDGWTSLNQVHLLGITVHWIDDDWDICERVLSVQEIDGPHSGEHMAEILVEILKEFCLMDTVSFIASSLLHSITLSHINYFSSFCRLLQLRLTMQPIIQR